MINLNLVQAWVNALRSGKYKQAKQALVTEYGYCCLGVACLIQDATQIEFKEKRVSSDGEAYGTGEVHYGFMYGGRLYSEWLPEEIGLNLGLDKEDQVILSQLNDEQDKNFNEIADFIEDKYLKGNAS